MKKRSFLGTDRKILVMILGIVMVSILTLTMAYAALSVTLNIAGSARVSSADWDIYLGNQKINDGSVANSTLSVSGVEADFSATFDMPGDYYEFTIDVINGGDIDAIITGVNKSSLTAEQAKLFNYTIEYENGNAINVNQRLDRGSSLRLLVKVEYKRDINNADLPSSQITVDFSFDLELSQNDGNTGSVVENNGAATPALISFYYNYEQYQAEVGMTWEEWINSDYNTLGVDEFYIWSDDSKIDGNGGYYITIESQSNYDAYFENDYDSSYLTFITPTTVIVEGEYYNPTA